MPVELSLPQARRIAIAAQRLDRPRPGRATRRMLADGIRRNGVLQLDFVNVVVPAHYQVLFSRIGEYPREWLDEIMYGSGEFHEQWAHEASILPNESWPLFAERRRTARPRPWTFEKFAEEQPEYMRWVLAHLQRVGPTLAADLPTPEGVERRLKDLWPSAHDGDGWYRSVPRAALDLHHTRGRAAVCARLPDFTRVYDRIERHVPGEIRKQRVAPRSATRRLLLQAAAANGVGTAADLADHFRMKVGFARPHLDELVERGDLIHVKVEGWRERAYLDPAARKPKAVQASALVSPFDPIVWCRPRAKRLYGFDYRVEIFVPPAKREHGFYVLPFLYGDRFAARVDLKLRRDEGSLAVQGAWIEEHADPDEVAPALAAELHQWARWLGVERVRCARKGNLARHLAPALRP